MRAFMYNAGRGDDSMIASKEAIRRALHTATEHMWYQGYDTRGAQEKLAALPDSYDSLLAFAEALRNLPMREGWRYVEPTDWEGVRAQLHPQRLRHAGQADLAQCARRVQTAFVGSVLGCMLGKPLEVDPDMDELRRAGEACGQWPIRDFISEQFLEHLGRRHPDWQKTTFGNIRCAVPDDDIHYTVLGMLNLEYYGANLTTDDVRGTWQRHQNINYAWGPERAAMARIAISFLNDHACPRLDEREYALWAETLNPGAESCGAAIRADAYGYAFPGRPDVASRLAFVDASFTHRRTGVYASMFVAAALALMPMASDPLDAFAGALDFVPQHSRFHEVALNCLDIVDMSAGFEAAYGQIHARYGQYRHCHVYQEAGTLVNTLKYAHGVWQGVCLQVMQGADTDSFGATAGSLLGMRFGPDGLDARRAATLNNAIELGLVDFPPQALDALAARMGRLPLRDWQLGDPSL